MVIKKIIIYFHLEEGQKVKRHIWNVPNLEHMTIDMGEDYELWYYEVPEYYSGKRPWDNRRLRETLQEKLEFPGVVDCYLQPELSRLLEIEEKLPPEILLRKILFQNSCWEELFLIGCEEEEIELLHLLLQEYLPRINHLAVIADRTDIYEEFANYIYEEYGIPTAYTRKMEERTRQRSISDIKKRAVIFDFESGYRPPYSVLPKESVYIDFRSEIEKRNILEIKRRDVCYLSVVKFLDTLV